MSNLLNISSSPHVRDKSSTRSIMWDVIFALIPTSIFGIYNFGIRAAVLIAVCIATCLLSEYIWQKCMKLPLTVNDGSAVLTGLLLALNLTPTFPIWMAILGSVFAIIIVKQLFGGLGQNFMNPALGGRCFLMLSFSSVMTSFTVKEGSNWYLRAYIDKPGGIGVNDCEAVSRRLSDILDEKDYIEDSYILEVSSPGLGRPLKKEKDFRRSLGEEVEIRTYRMIDRQKEFTGILKDYDETTVTIEMEDETEKTFEKSEIALIRLAFDF